MVKTVYSAVNRRQQGCVKLSRVWRNYHVIHLTALESLTTTFSFLDLNSHVKHLNALAYPLSVS